MKSLKNRPIIMGTLILTISGFLTRGLGFLFRIYSSRILGGEGMGLYQLSAPILALTYSLCAAGFHTAVSKLTAEAIETKKCRPSSILFNSLLLSLPLSVILSFCLFFTAPFISQSILLESRLTPYLRLLSLAFPFSALHACTSGYFYGIQKSHIPAISQIVEQSGRILFILLCLHITKTGLLTLMFLGIAAGEICGCIYNLCQFPGSLGNLPHEGAKGAAFLPLIKLAVPTGANRLTLTLMQSFEAIVLPNSLRLFGYTKDAALSLYGILTGMALPFLLFPNAITMSLATVLLPDVSSKYASAKKEALQSTIVKASRISLLLGGIFGSIFLFGGRLIGSVSFHNETAGSFLTYLALACPFVYLNTTFSGILQGLGKIVSLYASNLFCLSTRLCFVLFLVPKIGMRAFFLGFYVSQILQCQSYYRILQKAMKE